MRFRIAAAALAAVSLLAQSPTTKPPAFEVASIKPSTATDFNAGIQYLPGGRLTAHNMPLRAIIVMAYGLSFQPARLSGGPGWIRSERYDIEATAEAGAIPAGASEKVRIDKMKLMLQVLLADRFKLVIRHETKEIPVYAITVAKGGPKLEKAKLTEADCEKLAEDGNDSSPCHGFNGDPGRGLHVDNAGMADLAVMIETFSDRPVLDRTGLQGLYNIRTEGWVPLLPRPPSPPGAEPTAEDLARPSVFTIFDRLGLKLEATKAQVETFVIESVERPSGN